MDDVELWTDTQAEERRLPRRSITSRSNVTPSACSSARIQEKQAISHSDDTLQIHSARNTNSKGDVRDQRPGRPRTGAPNAAGFPNRRSTLTIHPSDSAGQAHYAMRRNSSQEMRNLMARTASSLPPAEWFVVEHALYSAGLLCSSRWWSDARALPLFVGPRTTSDGPTLPATIRTGRRE